MISMAALKCYLIGVIGNIAMGPVFFLTLKRSAQQGYWHGFASAFSAACADGVLFFMGMAGLLSFVHDSLITRLALFGFGGLFLLYLGWQAWTEHTLDKTNVSMQESISGIVLKTFVLTMINPGTVLYYVGASLSMIDSFAGGLVHNSIWGASIVICGAGTVLCSVVILARRFGAAIVERNLKFFTRLTGVLIMIFGSYCLYRFIMMGIALCY